MANEKKYEMLFALNARMNGGFSGTFSKAQAEFARLGKEVQGLHRIQGDIASYQKQQRAVEATKGKLESLQKQHDLLQKEIGETTGSTTGLEREEEKLAQRIKDAETALERQKQKLDATGAKLKDAGVDTSNLAQKDAELTAKIKELEAAQEKAAEGAASFGERSAQAVGAVQQAIAAAGIAVALKEIADAFMECVGVAGDFEETMSTVEALSQANSREMAALSEQAKELGATTKFTAQQAGDAMGYMAMAGWDANEMLQGMDGVLQLAAASGEDLAMVSDIVTDSLSAFGLTAADTAHFSDVLAAAATNSNTNVAIMGETFKMSASVAGALGYSIEDVAVAMGLMANSGVKGSIAGTALRNTFNGLLEGVTLTGAAFGEYEYSAVKADGTMKDFGSTIDELRGCFEQMTEAERVSNAMTIAGKRGYNGLLAILNATEEDYTSLTGSINDCTGAAQRMASVKLDNMNGQLTLMNSAWDALKTTIGEEFIPEARGLYALGTDIFTGLNEFVKKNPALVKAVVAFTGVIGAATVGLTAYAAIAKAVKVLEMGTLFAGPAGVLMGIIATVAAATALKEALKADVDESWELTAASRQQYNELQELNAEYERACELYGETSREADSLRWKVNDLTEEYESGRQTMDEYTAAHRAVMDNYDGIVASHEQERDALNNERNNINSLVAKLDELTSTTDGAAQNQEALLAVIDKLNESVPELALSYDDVVNSADGFIDSLYEVAKAQAEQKKLRAQASDYVDRVGQQDILKNEKEQAEQNARIIQEEYELAQKAYEEAEKLYKNDTSGLGSVGRFFGTREARAELEAAEKQLEDVNVTLNEATTAYNENEAAIAELETALSGYRQALDGTGTSAAELQGVIDSTTEELAALTEAYNKAYAAAFDSIHGQYALWDEAAEVVAVSAGSINSNLEGQAAYWRDYNANLQALSERSADIAGLGDVIASFADGSAESVNAIAGMAGATDEELSAMVTNWQELQAEQKAASDALAQIIVDVPGQMQELEDAMREGIEALEFSDEAAQGAHDTIQAFIDKAENMLPLVRGAYAQLGAAASSALAARFTYNSQGINNFYASGTENAEPGLALVGEKGPELVYFNGGEKVLTAAETEAVRAQWSAGEARLAAAFGPQVSGYPEALAASPIAAPVSAQPAEHLGGTSSPAPVSIQVAFQIEGNATPEVVEQLRTYGNEFAERVLEVMEEYGIDTARKAYT